MSEYLDWNDHPTLMSTRLEYQAMQKRIEELERSRDLCHYYAGCTPINCNLDGNDCPEARSKSHE